MVNQNLQQKLLYVVNFAIITELNKVNFVLKLWKYFE